MIIQLFIIQNVCIADVVLSQQLDGCVDVCLTVVGRRSSETRHSTETCAVGNRTWGRPCVFSRDS